jgi:flagellar assembly protein FliH
MDSQAELQIVPDITVMDFGCVIRSSFGSIDARVDTQLSEIKKALQQIVKGSGEDTGNEFT